jgi:hypothetical protein
MVNPGRPAAFEFGRRLANTHAAGADGFGAPPDGWTGDGFFGPMSNPLPMALTGRAGWGRFYADDRLAPMADRAGGRLTADVGEALGREALPLLRRGGGRLPGRTPPAVPEWRQRRGLRQLHPLLAHVVLFGCGYLEMTSAAVSSALRSTRSSGFSRSWAWLRGLVGQGRLRSAEGQPARQGTLAGVAQHLHGVARALRHTRTRPHATGVAAKHDR